MNKQPILLPAISAIWAPPLVSMLYFSCLGLVSGQATESIGSMLFLVGLFSFGISVTGMLIWGMPVALLLRKFNCLRWWSITSAGFVGAAIAMAIWSWPVDSKYRSGYSYWDGSKTVVAKSDGIPTFVGWMDYVNGIFWIGAFGAFTGLVFWLVSVKCSKLRLHTDTTGAGEPGR